MIEIDGSYGEGGGQILRSSIALSIITKTPVHITNIRANRPNPGIKPQHYTALSIMKEISQAKTEGLCIGSSTIQFYPNAIKGGAFTFDVGTAGSIVLIYQALLLATLRTTQPITIQLRGGTDVKWSPSWDYFQKVFLKTLNDLGFQANTQLTKRGYYPKGGGEATITIHPFDSIQNVVWDSSMHIKKIYGNIHIGGLPDHITQRMKHAVIKTLFKQNIQSDISIETHETLSPGTGITLWTEEADGCIGSVGLGERGVPADNIGKQSAEDILKYIQTDSTIDIYLMDQILPFLVQSNKDSIVRVKTLSNHAKTNMWIIEQFYQNKTLFEITEKNQYLLVRIHGQGKYK